jgi:tetratricopeptide (TPR) repeat protein
LQLPNFEGGNVFRSPGRLAEGIAEQRRATELAPNTDDAYRRLGRAYVESGRADEGIASLQRATEINPYFWVNYNTLGAAFLQLGDYDQAIQANMKVLELEPDNVNGYNDLGAAYLLSGQFEAAAEPLAKALELLPNPETSTNLAISYYYAGRFEEAVPLFERAVELSPNDQQWVGNLADGYKWAGLTTQAAATYDRAINLTLKQLEVNSRDAMARGFLGLYYAKRGDVTRGLRSISDARNIDRNNLELIYFEALANTLANRRTEALDALEAAFAAGYPAAFAAKEPYLAPLRSDPRYGELLKTYLK